MVVDGVTSGHVEDGLDDDLVVADPGPDLGEGGGAELFDVPDGEGVVAGVGVDVVGDVVGVEAEVDLDLARSFAGGSSEVGEVAEAAERTGEVAGVGGVLAGEEGDDDGEGLDLAFSEGAVSPWWSWWAMAQRRS